MTKAQKNSLIAAVLLAAVVALGLYALGSRNTDSRVQGISLEGLDEGVEGPSVELDPCGAEGMVISPSEDNSPRPGQVMVLIFRADGPFVLPRSARDKLLSVSSMPAEDAAAALERIHQEQP